MKKNTTRFIAVIPAFNEQDSIEDLVKKIKRYPFINKCIVVDDGSTDNTAKRAKKAGASLINTTFNIGTGRATHRGLNAIKRHNSSNIILLDADGQHDPKFIPHLISQMGDADLVIGSRYLSPTRSSTSWLRRMGTKIISVLILAKYRKRVFDPTSGYRVLNPKALSYFKNNYPYYFSEPEVVIEAIKNGMKIREVSIQMKPRLYGSSSINFMKAFRLMIYITKKILSDEDY